MTTSSCAQAVCTGREREWNRDLYLAAFCLLFFGDSGDALHEVGRVLIPVMHDWHALEIAREMRLNSQRRKCGFLPCFGSNRERHLATSPGRP